METTDNLRQDINNRIELATENILTEIDKNGFIFNGVVADLIEKHGITDREHIKGILNDIGMRNTQTRKFIYGCFK